MKLGVKTFDNEKFLKHFENNCDFYEIMAIEKNNYDFIKNLKLPVVIHAQHRLFGVNNADKTKKDINLSSISFAGKIADLSNAKKIILHPGEIKNENCSLKNSIEFFKNINDKRILVENMPIEANKKLCQTPEEIKEFMKKANVGFCLDINHAIPVAIGLKKDYIEFIKELIKLKPKHYHLGGQNIKHKKEHICLRNSDINLKEIMKIIPDDAEITLETEVDIKKTEDDLRIIKEIINKQ